MYQCEILKVGDVINEGTRTQEQIVGEDKYCFRVGAMNDAHGIRTISKSIIDEFVEYYKENPKGAAKDAKDALCGHSSNDKFEYGYVSTLSALAKAVLKKINIETSEITEAHLPKTYELSYQSIYYGAPGTGKSYTINQITKDESVIRTTFHPDSDYSSFVGAYKPTTVNEPVYTIIGTEAHPIVNLDGTPRTESKIVYKFICQAFLQAYIKAWKFYAETIEEGTNKKQFLIIEEINRGNCAQIFGDLFQLLDRNEYGFSDYPIQADADMKEQLKEAFKDVDIAYKEELDDAFPNHSDIASEILNGNLLVLPNNLYIWATMNTSDQSLFPIDSAFKRRWDWNYMPIYDADKKWIIEIGDNWYYWSEFLNKINELIGSTTYSEDKKLGYFFCKPRFGTISTDVFVSKVIFYLWNDVFKDYEFDDPIFNDVDGSKLTFDKFYETTSYGKAKVITEKVDAFLRNLNVPVIEIDEMSDIESHFAELEVMYEGETIKEKNSVTTFVKVCNMIGPDRIKDLNLTVYKGKALIYDSKEQPELPEGDQKSLKPLGNYWILTKFQHSKKVALLKEMADKLGLTLEAKLK